MTGWPQLGRHENKNIYFVIHSLNILNNKHVNSGKKAKPRQLGDDGGWLPPHPYSKRKTPNTLRVKTDT